MVFFYLTFLIIFPFLLLFLLLLLFLHLSASSLLLLKYLGIISRPDLTYILGCVTHRPRSKTELMSGINCEESLDDHLEKETQWDNFIESIVDEVMSISTSDPDDQYMTFEDFMQALATTQADFREKMNISFTLG